MSTQPPESEKPQEKSEHEQSKHDFYEEKSMFVESAEKVLSEYGQQTERELNRSEILVKTEEILSTVNLESVRSLSTHLLEVSDELQKLKIMIGRDEEKADRYAKVIDDLIKNGTKVLELLANELTKSGFLQHVEFLASRGVLTDLKLSYDDLPLSERRLIEQFHLSHDQTEMLWRIVTAYVRGKITRYDEEQYEPRGQLVSAALNQNLEFLKWYSSPESENDSKRGQRRVLILSGVSQIFCGSALVGLNVAGFMATAGLLLTLENTLMSSITGGAILLGGAKDVDLARYLD